MAALCSGSSSSSSALSGLQERQPPSCFLAAPSVSASFSSAGRPFAQKDIFGTALPCQRGRFSEDLRKQRSRLNVEAAKRVDKGRTFLLSSTLKAQEAEVEKVAKLCEGIRQWASVKQMDKSSGLKRFECYVDTFDKNVFHFLEEYESLLHMNDLRASSEATKFWEDVRPFLLEPIALAAYEQRDGRIGNALNPIGPKGEGGLDDATGQAGRGGEHYMKRKPKKRKDLEAKPETAAEIPGVSEQVEEDKWSFEKILARVLGANTEDNKAEKKNNWSLKALFGQKK